MKNEVIEPNRLWERAGAASGQRFTLGGQNLTAGLRYERTRLAIDGFRLLGNAVIAASGRDTYENWLPTLILRATPAEDFVARLACCRSLGRPQYSQLSPSGTITVEGNEAFVSSGNPALEPYVAD